MQEVISRFFEKVNKTDSCWLWTSNKGYGRFWNGSKLVGAHRFSYEYHNGKIPEGMYVCHSCDNPSCVNPEHLFLGTQKENMLDKIEKGRVGSTSLRYRGENAYGAKLTNAQAMEIRKLYSPGVNKRSLMRLFKVGRKTIDKILEGKSYASK